MPALNGEVIITITDAGGSPIFVIFEFFDATTKALRDSPQVTSDGLKTGALVVDNMTAKPQRITVTDGTGAVRTVNVPARGVALTAAQLAAIPAPDGPFLTIADFAGLSPSLT